MFNDRKAPRFSSRTYRKNIVSKELYEKWKIESGYDITFKEFRSIWDKLAAKYVQNVIEEKDGVRLGASVGDIYIGFIPQKKTKAIDYATSLELGKPVYFQNWHSNGKIGKIIYGTRKRKYIYRLAAFWAFTACRNFKNLAVKAMKENPERYKNSIEKRSLL